MQVRIEPAIVKDKIMACLTLHQPISGKDMADVIGVRHNQVRYHLIALHKDSKVRISEYIRHEIGGFVALYSAGSEPDVEMPSKTVQAAKEDLNNPLRELEKDCLAFMGYTFTPVNPKHVTFRRNWKHGDEFSE